jgi:hypothetical protein
LEIDERRSASLTGITHIRRIVVETAPALFIVACADRACRDGGHDLTREIMSALGRGLTEFGGEHTCQGQLGPALCGSVLRYVAVATFTADASARGEEPRS